MSTYEILLKDGTRYEIECLEEDIEKLLELIGYDEIDYCEGL
jgi:hypothetical protein